jgi:hypothetical protein
MNDLADHNDPGTDAIVGFSSDKNEIIFVPSFEIKTPIALAATFVVNL